MGRSVFAVFSELRWTAWDSDSYLPRSDLLGTSPRGRAEDMEGADLAMKLLSTWLTLVIGLILLPSAFGLSIGISEIYMKILVKTLEVSECREGCGAPAALRT